MEICKGFAEVDYPGQNSELHNPSHTVGEGNQGKIEHQGSPGGGPGEQEYACRLSQPLRPSPFQWHKKMV